MFLVIKYYIPPVSLNKYVFPARAIKGPDCLFLVVTFPQVLSDFISTLDEQVL